MEILKLAGGCYNVRQDDDILHVCEDEWERWILWLAGNHVLQPGQEKEFRFATDRGLDGAEKCVKVEKRGIITVDQLAGIADELDREASENHGSYVDGLSQASLQIRRYINENVLREVVN